MHICDSGLHNVISVTVYTYVLRIYSRWCVVWGRWYLEDDGGWSYTCVVLLVACLGHVELSTLEGMGGRREGGVIGASSATTRTHLITSALTHTPRHSVVMSHTGTL